MGGTDEETPEITAEIAELLQRKGALEILVRIGSKRSQRHTDLRTELLISSSTIQDRLNAGKELGLWEQTLRERDGVAHKVYRLTDVGETLYERAEDLELVELYRSRRGLIRTIQNRERQFIIEGSPTDAEWITDIEMEEHDTRFVQKFLQQFHAEN